MITVNINWLYMCTFFIRILNTSNAAGDLNPVINISVSFFNRRVYL